MHQKAKKTVRDICLHSSFQWLAEFKFEYLEYSEFRMFRMFKKRNKNRKNAYISSIEIRFFPKKNLCFFHRQAARWPLHLHLEQWSNSVENQIGSDYENVMEYVMNMSGLPQRKAPKIIKYRRDRRDRRGRDPVESESGPPGLQWRWGRFPQVAAGAHQHGTPNAQVLSRSGSGKTSKY